MTKAPYIRMLHEPAYRAMWHDNCTAQRFSSPMKPLTDKRVNKDGYELRLWECVPCGVKAWHGYNNEGRQIVEPEFWQSHDRGLVSRVESAAPAPSASPADKFQARVQPWMLECFGAEIAADQQERNHRFLEESLELVQACGASVSEAHQLVDYVYGRPVGEKHQEAGGVMVTLAALCLAQGLDMHAAGETELARIWTKVEQIRAKQAAKPKHSPLPQHVPAASPAALTEQARSVLLGNLECLEFCADVVESMGHDSMAAGLGAVQHAIKSLAASPATPAPAALTDAQRTRLQLMVESLKRSTNKADRDAATGLAALLAISSVAMTDERAEHLAQRVETAVGMYRAAWDCIDAKEIVRALLAASPADQVEDARDGN